MGIQAKNISESRALILNEKIKENIRKEGTIGAVNMSVSYAFSIFSVSVVSLVIIPEEEYLSILKKENF